VAKLNLEMKKMTFMRFTRSVNVKTELRSISREKLFTKEKQFQKYLEITVDL
jgi:hypothetical protein